MKLRNLILIGYLICLAIALTGPLDRAEFLYSASRALQAVARRTGQVAIKLETKAYEEVQS